MITGLSYFAIAVWIGYGDALPGLELLENFEEKLSRMRPEVARRQEDSSCPINYTAPNGLQFDMYCEHNIALDDLTTTPAQSVTECMQICSTYHPICHGVAFNIPSSTCWLKNANFPSGPANSENFTNAAVANAQQLEPLAYSCSSSSDTYDTANKTFRVSCNQWSQGTNISNYHESDIDACMDTCATWSGNGECKGVVFDAAMNQGYDNCYLMSDIPAPSATADATVATIIASSSNNSSSSGSLGDKKSSTHTGAIAGGVVGGIVGLTLVAGMFLFFRRRKQALATGYDPYSPNAAVAGGIPNTSENQAAWQQQQNDFKYPDKSREDAPRAELDATAERQELP